MVTKIKSDLRFIAEHLPANASYGDVMYELYVRMKVAQGKRADSQGRVMDHQEVKRKFLR